MLLKKGKIALTDVFSARLGQFPNMIVKNKQATFQPERARSSEAGICRKVGFALYTAVLRLIYSGRYVAFNFPT
jgi:hypothetical protein